MSAPTLRHCHLHRSGAGTIEPAIPKLRQGSYFPDWLLERRRRAEQARIGVVATSYLLGVSTAGWTSWFPPQPEPFPVTT
ncbi:hypothetical protein Hesp01_74180 [Herbidospora sp. NBRC 101105]|nr:hypothetical protein Hesp01_74180 [Herbidospora sp. NBRC 101105]